MIERGSYNEKIITEDLFEVTYLAIGTDIFSMASLYESMHRKRGKDPRRILFAKELELFKDGFAEKPSTKVLKPGTVIDRYGNEKGRFVSPKGTSYNARSLKPGTSRLSRKTYVVNRPLRVKAGIAAPAFNRPGGGIQYKLPRTVKELLDKEVLKKRRIFKFK